MESVFVHQVSLERVAPHPQDRLRVLLSYIVIGVVALVLRGADLGGFVTIDEAKFWLPRSERFLDALQHGTIETMPVAVQPGVTTMWLGSAGIALRRVLFDYGVLHTETYPVLLSLHRLPTVLVHVAGVLFGYALLRRLVSPLAAFLAAWLWATDPFVVAFSRVLHVDALAGTFATLCLLAACVALLAPHDTHPVPRLRWLVVSGICAGLAILSKSPALAVAPVVGVLVLARAGRASPRPLLVWGTSCATTMVLLWPVVWVDPVGVYEALRFGVESEGGQPHMWGNFFMGQVVDTPGPLFYPVALVLRSTPWTLAGVLLLPLAMYRRGGRDNNATVVRDSAVLAAFVVLFVVGMSLFSKKMNRYLVPVFPAFDVLAAIGLAWVFAVIGQQWERVTSTGNRRTLATRAVVGIAGVLFFLLPLANTLWYHPYAIVAYNQVFGGAQKGAQVFLTGWGEGFGEVAAWLNQQPDSQSVVTATSLPSVLNPYLHDGVFANSAPQGVLPGSTGYLVVYISQVQRDLAPPYDRYYGHVPPLHTVTLHGVNYAWVYQVPREMSRSLVADFGGALQLHGYDVDTSAVQHSGTLTLTVQWQVRAPPEHDYNLFVHVFDAQGQQVSQLDVPLLDPHAPTSIWQAGRVVQWVHPVPVPQYTPPGGYRAGIGVYNPVDFSRLPVRGPAQPGMPDDGPGVIFLTVDSAE